MLEQSGSREGGRAGQRERAVWDAEGREEGLLKTALDPEGSGVVTEGF